MRASLERWGWRRRNSGAAPSADGKYGSVPTSSDIQVFAHSMIADLFGVGLRVQNLANGADGDMHDELAQVAEQIDKAIGELRSFAFTHRP